MRGTTVFRVSVVTLMVGIIGVLAVLGFGGWFRGPSGDHGQQGIEGRPGETLGEFMGLVHELWQSADQSDYDYNLITFIETHFYERFRGIPGANTNMVVATDRALRSSVTVHSSVGTGSGVVYQIDPTTREAFILTNFHVISRLNASQQVTFGTNVRVFFFGMQPTSISDHYTAIPAQILGVSPTHDLAVLRVAPNQIPANLPVQAAVVPTRLSPRVGEPIIAVGNPIRMEYGLSVTEGIVSNYSQHIDMQNLEGSGMRQYRVFRTTAAVNQGNSGGGMFNAQGELVGIVMAKLSSFGQVSVDNIGYIIPMDIADRVARQFIWRADYFTGGTPLQLQRPVFGMFLDSRNMRFDVRPGGETFVRGDVIVDRFVAPNYVIETILAPGDIIRRVSFWANNRAGVAVLHEINIYQPHHLIDAMIDAHNRSVTTGVVFTIQRAGYQGGAEHNREVMFDT